MPYEVLREMNRKSPALLPVSLRGFQHCKHHGEEGLDTDGSCSVLPGKSWSCSAVPHIIKLPRSVVSPFIVIFVFYT